MYDGQLLTVSCFTPSMQSSVRGALRARSLSESFVERDFVRRGDLAGRRALIGHVGKIGGAERCRRKPGCFLHIYPRDESQRTLQPHEDDVIVLSSYGIPSAKCRCVTEGQIKAEHDSNRHPSVSAVCQTSVYSAPSNSIIITRSHRSHRSSRSPPQEQVPPTASSAYCTP